MATIDPRDRRFIHPIDVVCEGWKSNSVALERYGWRFEIQEDYMRSRMFSLIMYHRSRHSFAVHFSNLDMSQFRDVYTRGSTPLYIAGDPFSRVEGTHESIRVFEAMRPVYMEDAMMTERENHSMGKSVYDIFPQSAQPQFADEEKEIIVPDEKTVEELMAMILKKQVPDQEIIRANANRRKRRQATIITMEEIRDVG